MPLRPLRRAALLVALTAPTVSAAPLAQAAGATSEAASARADRLFREGKAALEAKRFAEACPKLAESQKLDPGTGTLLALGLCHEALGATASALSEFRDVVVASEKARPDRAALARQHADAVSARLSTVSIVVPPESRGHVAVRIDGLDVAADRWANALPLDPGDHTVEASVPGGAPWQSTIHIAPGPSSQAVTTPALEPAPAVAPVSPPPVATDAVAARRKTGWIAAGAGGGVLVLGAVFGGIALAEHGSATTLCPSSTCSNDAGVSDESQAKTLAWVSDFGVGLGLVGLGVGAYLLLTHADAPHPASIGWAPRVTPTAYPGGGGVALGGDF